MTAGAASQAKFTAFAAFEFGLSDMMQSIFRESLRLQFSNTTAFDPFMQVLTMHNALAPPDVYLNLISTVSKLYFDFLGASRNLRVPFNGTGR